MNSSSEMIYKSLPTFSNNINSLNILNEEPDLKKSTFSYEDSSFPYLKAKINPTNTSKKSNLKLNKENEDSVLQGNVNSKLNFEYNSKPSDCEYYNDNHYSQKTNMNNSIITNPQTNIVNNQNLNQNNTSLSYSNTNKKQIDNENLNLYDNQSITNDIKVSLMEKRLEKLEKITHFYEDMLRLKNKEQNNLIQIEKERISGIITRLERLEKTSFVNSIQKISKTKTKTKCYQDKDSYQLEDDAEMRLRLKSREDNDLFSLSKEYSDDSVDEGYHEEMSKNSKNEVKSRNQKMKVKSEKEIQKINQRIERIEDENKEYKRNYDKINNEINSLTTKLTMVNKQIIGNIVGNDSFSNMRNEKNHEEEIEYKVNHKHLISNSNHLLHSDEKVITPTLQSQRDKEKENERYNNHYLLRLLDAKLLKHVEFFSSKFSEMEILLKTTESAFENMIESKIEHQNYSFSSKFEEILKIFYEKTKVIDQINDQNRKIYNKIQEVDSIQKEIERLTQLCDYLSSSYKKISNSKKNDIVISSLNLNNQKGNNKNTNKSLPFLEDDLDEIEGMRRLIRNNDNNDNERENSIVNNEIENNFLLNIDG